MRKRKLRGGIAVLSLATALCLAQGVAVYAEGTDDGSTLVTADLSKGIEYRYYEGSTTRVEGINLNGNSVIIRQSPNSTSSEPRLNVYNDKDRDGVLDEGEEAFEIDGSTDILPYQVYGVYGEKTKTPISITVDGASLGNVWGVYKGTMEYESTGSDPAVSITVNKGSNVSAATCLYSSEAVGSMKINISGDCNVSQLQGALQSKVDGDIDVDITDNAFAGTVYGIQVGYASGSVDVYTDNTVDVGYLYGVYASTIDGSLTVNSMLKADKGSGYVYAATNGTYSGKDYAVKGNVVLTAKNAKLGYVYAVTNGAHTLGGVTVDISNTTLNEMYGVSNSASAAGDVSIRLNGIECSDSYSSMYGAYSANIAGKLKFEVMNAKGKGISVYGTSNSDILGDVDIDIDGQGAEFASVYGLNGGTVKGMVNIDIENINVSSSMYGIYSAKLEQSSPEGADAYANVITLKNIVSSSYYTYGVYYVSTMGSTHMILDNIKSGNYLYGLDFSGAITGKLKMDISNCSAENVYILRGNGSSPTVVGDFDLTLTDSAFKNSLYVLNTATFAENASVDIRNVISNLCTVAYSGTCAKNLDVNMQYANDKAIVDAAGNPVVDSYTNAGKGEFNLLSSYSVIGDLTADLSNIHYASCGLAGGSYSGEVSGINTTVTLKDSSFESTYNGSTVYLLNEYGNGSNDDSAIQLSADIKIENTDFTGMKNASFQVNANQNRKVRVAFDETCILSDGYYICPAYNGYGDSIVTYGGDVYYGGDKVVIDKDVNADNIYFGNYASGKSTSAVYAVINKGVTVSAQEGIYFTAGANILNSGKFSGTFKRTDDSSYGSVYMKEGIVADETLYENAHVYYPVTLVCDDKAVTVSNPGYTCYLDKDTMYAYVDSVLTLTPVIKRGYTLEKVVFRGSDETQDNELTETSGKYTFAMPKKPCIVTVSTKGKQIKASKTVSDPSAVLGQKYTAEKPLYDMSDVVILNDGKEGTVTYEMDKDYILPEGLVLDGGLIIGTPTLAYEDGKKAVIHITGKNGTKTQITLNVVVSKEQKIQENTDGRITVDEENKQISLNGTSVVLQAAENSAEASADETGAESPVITEIYIDSNKDGQADNKTPLVSGALSEYTVVGVDDSEFKRSVKITMLGGSVQKIYGAVDSELSCSGRDAVAVVIKGGNVGEVYAIVNTQVDGTISYENCTGAVITGGLVSGSTSTYTGALLRTAKDNVMIYKKYTVTEKLVANDFDLDNESEASVEAPLELTGYLRMYEKSKLTATAAITAGGLSFSRNSSAQFDGDVKINTLYMTSYNNVLTIGAESEFETNEVKISDSWAKVYQKGTFKCPSDKFSNEGTWVKAGEFAEGVDAGEWAGIYYNVERGTTNMKGTSVSIPTQSRVVEYEGLIYARNNSLVTAEYTDVPGYTVYVSINGGDPIKGDSGSAQVATANTVMSATADYVADQIAVTKKYADPVIVADTSYTAEEPVYDLSALDVTGDTTSAYGTDMQYRVKSGSKLPEGLVLADGKITGKTSETGETDVTFVVTGRNGTSVDVNVKFTVKAAGTEVSDINKVVTDASVSKINLAGCSVVIIADPSNSSKSSIYMDADHDGIADNNRALKIGGETSYDLSKCKIYGYTDGDNAYTGDISIVLRSGTVGSLYGVGSNESGAANVTVEGDVTVKVLGGTVRTEIYGAYNAHAATVNFVAEGGKIYKKACGAYNSDVQTMNFAFTKTAMMYADDNYSNTGEEELYVTSGGSVSGDVNAEVGVLSTREAFAYSSKMYRSTYAFFYGVYRTPVSGDVNYTLNGDWYAGRINTFVNSSNVAGDLNAELKSGYIGCGNSNDSSKAFVYGNTNNKIRNINVRSATEDAVSGKIVLAASGEVNDIYFNDVSGNTTASVTGLSENFQVTHKGSLFLKIKDKLVLGGTYTVDENIETDILNVTSGSKIKVAEGASIKHTANAVIEGDVENNGTWTSEGNVYVEGTFVNNGIWNTKKYMYVGDSSASSISGKVDNYGTVTTVSDRSYSTRINASSMFINREAATFTFGNMVNSGTIVNYGSLEETYYNNFSDVGKVLTTTIPNLKYVLKNYSSVYYKVDAEYPAYCFKGEDAKISIAATNANYQKTSGIDGDTNVYIAGNMDFYVTVDGEPIDGMKIDSVVYGSAQNEATSSNNVKWRGTVAYEPTHAVINMAKQEATNITLAKAEDKVTAQVGVTTSKFDPLYDLTKIEVQNDENVENGYVAYSLAKGQTLPDGLAMSGGKIYGTPVKASAEAQTVNIIVRGQNQTTAEFTLTIEKIEKGIPTLAASKAGTAYAGKTLADVALPKSVLGVYSWADSTQLVGKAGSEDNYDAYFVPKDTVNYDWSKFDTASGTYEQLEDGSVRISVKLAVYVRKQDPVYTVPEGVTAIYGETVGKAVIPEAEGGMFIWENADESVGDVGTKKFLATFVPSDEDVYERAEHIEITVEVKPAEAKFTQAIDKLTAKENDTLADIVLPEAENGIYTWYTDRTTKAEDGGTYKLCFKPADITNYDWSGVEGWNRAYRGVVFPVQVEIIKEHVHDYGDAYKSDATYHWKECSCKDIQNKAKHTFDSGSIKTSPTDTTDGSKVYKCKVCGYVKTVTIPALGRDITDPGYKIKVSGLDSQKYTGRTITLKNLKVTSGRTVLRKGTDYTVAYSNNKKHGTATVTINGIGKYRGTITETFQIKIVKNSVFAVKQPGTNIVYKYKITNADLKGKGTVGLIGTTVAKSNGKFKTLTISDTVTIDGVKFKVTAIGSKAFKDYKSIVKVAGGANVVSVGTYAFSGCTALKTIPAFKNVTAIGGYAFYKCKSLTAMPVNNKLKTIGKAAFYGCTSLKTLTVGGKVTTIGESAFGGCSKMTAVSIGANVKTIGASAFSGCKSLATVKVGSAKLKTVSKNAFKGTKSKITFKIPKKYYKSYMAKIKAKGVAAPKNAIYKKVLKK